MRLYESLQLNNRFSFVMDVCWMCSRGIIEATTLSFYMNGKLKRVVEVCDSGNEYVFDQYFLIKTIKINQRQTS